MDELIKRVQERIQRPPAVDMDAMCVRTTETGELMDPAPPNPPCSQRSLEQLEEDFEFGFPTIIRRLYTEVADGGYGPAWGINRLRQPPDIPAEPAYPEMMSIESWYRLEREEWTGGCPPEYWPHPFIRFCEVGCNIYMGVDCSTQEAPVVKYDPNLSHDDKACLIPVADSLVDWLTAWLDEEPWE